MVTGGLGYIGSATARRLLELGHEILIIDDARDSIVPENFFENRLILEDIGDCRSVSRIREFAPDVIFHFAGSTSVGWGERYSISCAENNVGAFGRFLMMFSDLLPDLPRKIVHAGSAAVYGDGNTYEDSPRSPKSLYGM